MPVQEVQGGPYQIPLLGFKWPVQSFIVRMLLLFGYKGLLQ